MSAATLIAELHRMQAALVEMERELPDDMKPLGAEARRRADLWLARVASGSADMKQLSSDMAELSEMMNALTARLLLQPWDSDGAKS